MSRLVDLGLECSALTGATLTERLHVTALLARRAARGLRRRLASPGRLVGRLRTGVPDRLLIAPQDIRTSDPTTAADIAAGYFAFGGKIVNAMGRSPFAAVPGSDAWARQLAGFGWLRHLRAADDAGGRARARDLVDDFLVAFPRPSPHLSWEPSVAARRLLSWLSQSPIILAGADREFYFRFMLALARHAGELEGRLAGGLVGSDRLVVALALAEYGLCIEGGAAQQRRGSEALAAEIVAQILPDGGHIGRNPQVEIDLLLDLLPLRQAYAARAIPAPQPVLNAIDRMMPMLRLFRHGDGTLALFNGMGATAPELVATILAYDDIRAQPATNARYAGYQRVEAASTLLIVDSGVPPPRAFSSQAHAGCLSFELSSGLRRLVVNCGAIEGGRAGVKEAARSTAAHSTLIVADTSSCRFASTKGLQRWLGEQILAGPSTVTADRVHEGDGIVLSMSHDGYVPTFGLVHRRSLTLADDGARLAGTDALVARGARKSAAVDYALRFHLHPSIKARAESDGTSVRLDTPDGESWLFRADADAFVEPSILFAASGGPRPSLQIRVAADTGAATEIRWSFQRIAAADRGR